MVFVCFVVCMHVTGATRGQYLALSTSWQSCFPMVIIVLLNC